MRRRPTQIVEPRPAATAARATEAAGSSLPANLRALSEQWVRDVCPSDALHRAETLKRWRIATGQDSGNPEQTAGRSKVHRHQPNHTTPAHWRKEYQHSFGVYEQHELLVLVKLWSAHAQQDQHSPRDFHAQAVMLGNEANTAAAAGPSRLQRLVTKDAGPNLLSWEYFQPFTVLDPQQLAWPLFAHPLFLAAITHRLLVATEVLFAHKVVHLDVKPENIGMALLSLQPTGNPTRLQGQWPLKALPLKLLDFEFSVHHGLSYPGMPPCNEYTSPFARQRLAVAAAQENQNNAWVQAVDWGADLFSLGHMLADWVAWSLAFHEAYVLKLRNELGPLAHNQHLAALCQKQCDDLVWLESFARKLQAQDRPAEEALVSPLSLPARPATPLVHLRAELAVRFAALQDGARALELPFFMQLPPGAVGVGSQKNTSVNQKAPSITPSGPSLVAQAWATCSRTVARHRAALLASTVALALPAAAWHWRADLHTAAAHTSATWAQQAVATALAPEGSAWSLRPALWLADELAPGQSASTVLKQVTALQIELGITAPTIDTPETRHTAHTTRLRYQRAVERLAALPNDTLAQPEAMDTGKKILLGLYNHSRWLENLEDTNSLPTQPAPLLAALGHLFEQQGWPLAALLAVHWGACYAPEAVNTAQQTRWLQDLRQLPANTPGRSTYVTFAQDAQRRLSADQSACLL